MIKLVPTSRLEKIVAERGKYQGEMANYESSLDHGTVENLMRGGSYERMYIGDKSEGIKINELELEFWPDEYKSIHEIIPRGNEKIIYEFYVRENPNRNEQALYMHNPQKFQIIKKESNTVRGLVGYKDNGKFVAVNFGDNIVGGGFSTSEIDGEHVYTDIHAVGDNWFPMHSVNVGKHVGNGPRFSSGLTREEYNNRLSEFISNYRMKLNQTDQTGNLKNVILALEGVREGFIAKPGI